MVYFTAEQKVFDSNLVPDKCLARKEIYAQKTCERNRQPKIRKKEELTLNTELEE